MSVDTANGAGFRDDPPATPPLDDGEFGCLTLGDPSGRSVAISTRLEASDRPGDVPDSHGVVTGDEGPRSDASVVTWAERP
jgi:hypothetical protein